MFGRIRRQVFAGLLLAFFVAHTVSVNFFVHSHLIDGQRICHSHFFGGGTPENPGHSHSMAQIVAIDLISHLLAVVPAVLLIFVFSWKKNFRYFLSRSLCKPRLFFYNLRAPPVF